MNLLNNPQMVPIGYICEELDIDPSTLTKEFEHEDVEQILKEIDPKFKFNAEQSKFLKLVSDDIDDNLLGLLNVLCSKSNYDMLYKCLVMEMVSFIYHEIDDDDNNDNNNDNNEYDIEYVYNICDIIKIPRSTINEIDSTVKQRLGTDSKLENLFIKNGDSP